VKTSVTVLRVDGCFTRAVFSHTATIQPFISVRVFLCLGALFSLIMWRVCMGAVWENRARVILCEARLVSSFLPLLPDSSDMMCVRCS
jgi:hypothetical protein